MCNHDGRKRNALRRAHLAGALLAGLGLALVSNVQGQRSVVGADVVANVALSGPTEGQTEQLGQAGMKINVDGSVVVHGRKFLSWAHFLNSDFARVNGLPSRCGTVAPSVAEKEQAGGSDGGSAADCTYTFTNPADVYDPSIARYRIPVVVHVIHSLSGEGYLSPEQVHSQIDILNEDFLALPGTNGGPGTDISVEFFLADVDPQGNPTTGITYTANDVYFLDAGPYYDELAWDPHRYLNIYTNIPMGAGGLILGYVAFFPQDGPVGSNEDRVVILYTSFGRNSPNPPYHQGRTATHEVGHYLGLFHTFQDGCGVATAPGCYSSADRICDTNPDADSHGGCPTTATSCGGYLVPARNYMEYTDDLCMNNFTPEQSRRIRCTLEHWRPLVYHIPQDVCPADIAGNDGVVNVSDLLAVINAWGPCSGACPADITGDGQVNVSDLLAVINNWGPCP